MALVRYPDWQRRLDQFLRETHGKRFAYGTLDCCLFVCDAVLVMTGTDLATSFRGGYRSRKQALQLAKAQTGKASIRALVEAGLSHLETIPVPCAQRGDIVLVKRSNDHSLGLIGLNGKEILAVSATGFLRLPLSLGSRAWRV